MNDDEIKGTAVIIGIGILLVAMAPVIFTLLALLAKLLAFLGGLL